MMKLERKSAPDASPVAETVSGHAPGNGVAPRRMLGELLVEAGALDAGGLQRALKRQQRDRRKIGEILVEFGVVADRVVAALAAQAGVLAVDLEAIEVDPTALACLDAPAARARDVLPYRIDDNGELHVVTPNPFDETLQAELTEQLGRMVTLDFADKAAVRSAIDRYYGIYDIVSGAAAAAVRDGSVFAAPVAGLASLSADAPVVRIVDLILRQGLRDRVSDIHIEPQPDRLRIRYRVDGALRDVQSLPVALSAPIASRLKIMADMDIVDRHRAQDGQTTIQLDGRDIDVRIATMETIWGEKVVLRLLDRSRSLLPLSQLGLREEEHQRLQRLINSPYGLFIVAGPTGAGKTTTLYAALNELDRQGRNITTIEDPVEYQFDNINQIQINRLAGMTFANGLRAILRQDPDVILVGEIRDSETAQIAIQSALTGHLVMASLHAADAVGALHRFLDMGVESYLVASAVIGVVAQRLVRLVCTKCAMPVDVHPDEAAFYLTVRGTAAASVQGAGIGCRHCGETGFFDRQGVFECMGVDDEVRQLIIDRATQSELRDHARAHGMRTLQDAACDLVDESKTTIAEAMRTVYVL